MYVLTVGLCTIRGGAALFEGVRRATKKCGGDEDEGDRQIGRLADWQLSLGTVI